MKWLSKAKKDRVVFINNKTNDVTYLPHTKTRSLNNPEEQVQLQTYLSLIYDHGYPAENIRVCVPVKMGSATKEADIITYNDQEGYQPYMIVECKKKGVSSSVFEGAIDQGFSYASATLAKYVWTTDGKKNAYHEVLNERIGERKNNTLPSPPPFEGSNNIKFQFKVALFRLFNAPVKLLGGLFKIPSIQNALIYIGLLLTVMTLLTKVALNNMHSILKASNTLWMEYGMDFSWIYYVLAFTSLMITISVGGVMSFIPNMGRKALKKKQIILLSIFLFIPVWFAGSEFAKAWWNWEHYTSMKHQMWMFMGPQLAIAPIQLVFFAVILSLSNKKPIYQPQRKRLAR